MIFRYGWKCPHCGMDNNSDLEINNVTVIKAGNVQSQIVYCDAYRAGCGKRVVTDVSIHTVVALHIIEEPQS